MTAPSTPTAPRKSTLPIDETGPVLRHLAVILDGNRRWAHQHRTDVATAYRRGGDRVHDLLSWCEATSIEVVTLWPLSTDNLARDTDDLAPLLHVISEVIEELADAGRWRIHLLGEVERLPQSITTRLRRAEQRTHSVQGLLTNIAVAYGGHDEITTAVRHLLIEHAALGTPIATIAGALTPQQIAEHLSTCDQPNPDLIIRTSGEQRLSGFMSWQSAYSEYHFSPVNWPDFDKKEFDHAITIYRQRRRRFGQ